jgi:branched-chain amino acid transport system substrate-binding protein
MPWPLTLVLTRRRSPTGAHTGGQGRRGPVALAVAAMTVLAAACTACSGAAAASGRDPYTIGLITSQTGPASQLGVGELHGARLAVAEVNARGGVNGHRLSLRTADDQSNPEQAVLATRKMLPRVGAIIGPSVAGPCNAVAPLADQENLINYCLSPGIRPRPGSTTWSASADTQTLAQRLVGYWHKRGVTRIGLLSTTDASGINGALSVRAAVAGEPGMRLTGAASYDPTAISVTSQLQVATGHRPQALIVWASGAAAGVAFKGLSQQGNTLPVATTDANLTYTFLQRIAAYAPRTLLIPATRDFWASQAGGRSGARQAAYRGAFLHRFHQEPDFGPGVAYDAVKLVAEALRRSGGDAAAAVKDLAGMRTFPGVLGTYSFSASDHRGLGIDDVAIVRATRNGFDYEGR